MSTAATSLTRTQCVKTFSAEVCSPADIDPLVQMAQRAETPASPRIDPRLFLRSLSKRWDARILVVRCGSEIAGGVFTKERKIAGVPIGIVYANGSLGDLVLAEVENREAVFRTALEKLLGSRRMRAVRLVVPPDGYEVTIARDVAQSMGWDCSLAPVEWNHGSLPLPETYEAFLNSLGPRTRRNFRYYRRKFEDDKHQFIPQLSTAEMGAALKALRAQCSISSSPTAANQKLKWAVGEDRPFACGLKNEHGEWLSLAVGFHDPKGATLLLQQNNDLDFERSSLSIVLRGYLIESLIQGGVRELTFWGGPSGALSRYVKFTPGTIVCLDSPGRGWKTVRSFVRFLAPTLPRRMRENVDWIAPRPGPVLIPRLIAVRVASGPPPFVG